MDLRAVSRLPLPIAQNENALELITDPTPLAQADGSMVFAAEEDSHREAASVQGHEAKRSAHLYGALCSHDTAISAVRPEQEAIAALERASSPPVSATDSPQNSP